MTNLDVIAYAKWLAKEVKSKKRFVYRNKLTKFGALAVTFSLVGLTQKFLKEFNEILKDGSYERNK